MMPLKTHFIIPVLVTLLLILLLFLPFGPGWLTDMTTPARTTVVGGARQLGEYWSWIGDVRRMSQHLDELASERNKLMAKLAKLESVERENLALRKQLSLGKKVDQKLILAKSAGIIEKGSQKYLLITAGAKNGVRVGQIALSDQVLVGKVVHVSQSSSLLEIPQTSSSLIPVIIRRGTSTTKGVVRANFNLTARIDQVMPDEKLQQGDTIVTSGEGGTYPADIVVGTVGEVAKSEQEVFQSASISIPWSITELETIFLVE